MGLKHFIRNMRALGKDDAVTRADFTLDHAPDWVFDVMSTGVTSAGGVSSAMDVPGLYRPAENVLMVFGCIIARREAIGKVPRRISDPEGNLITSGPLIDLLDAPNPMSNWSQYIRELETYNTLYNIMIVAVVGDTGLPESLVPLNPAYLNPYMGVYEPTGTPVVIEYRYSDPITGRQKIFKPEQLLIHKGFNPHAPLAPLSPINVLRRTMQADIVAREQNLALFQNDARPAGILTNENRMTKEQAEEVLNHVESRLKGYQNRKRLLALWGGLKYQDVGLTPVEMEYLNGLKFLRTDYYIVFRVPPAMIYEVMPVEMGKGNEATESAKVQWWEDVGLSELETIAALHQPIVDRFFRQGRGGRVGRTLMRSERDSYRRFIRRSAVNVSQDEARYALWFDDNSIPALGRYRLGKLDQMVKVLGMGYLPDDANAWLDLDLPEHPDNLGRVAFNLQVIGGNQTTDGGRQTTDQTDQQQKSAPVMRALDRLEEVLRADVPAKYAGLRKVFDAFLKPREKAAAKKWSRFFVEQRERVLARVATLQRADAGKSANAADAELARIFPRQEEDSQLVMRIAPIIHEHMVDGVRFFEKEIGVDLKGGMAIDSDPRLMRAVEERQIQGRIVNDTTEERLREIIRTSFEEGMTTRDMGDRIAKYYADNCVGEGSARAMTAANTQTAGIVNEGRMIAAEEVGGLKKGWLHGGSKDPREGHMTAQREYLNNPIPLDEDFKVDGYECSAPGDSSLPPEEVCNCTCMAVFVKG